MDGNGKFSGKTGFCLPGLRAGWRILLQVEVKKETKPN